MDDIFDLGIPGPSGNENDTYVAVDTIYKVNNLLNSGGICKLLDKILLHNQLFPNTAYRFHGFTGYDNENDTYVAKDTIYKVNNLLNSGGICKLLDKILLHNQLFPNTAYRFHGFTGYDGRTVMPVLEQERICESQPATQIMIDTYMAALGFERDGGVGSFKNDKFRVWDLVPRNVLVDKDGDMYVIDAEIAMNNERG